MKILKRWLSLALCLCLCAGLLPAQALAADIQSVQVQVTVDYSAASQALEQLNALRAAAGVDPLVMDEGMMEMARDRAAECAVYYSHTRPNGLSFNTVSPYQGGSMAENILYHSGNCSASTAINTWNNSSGHQQNMLSSSYHSVGIACVRDLAGQTYWVQNFFSGGSAMSSPPSGTSNMTFLVDALTSYLGLSLSVSSLRLEVGDKTVVYVRNSRKTPLVPTIIQTSDDSVASLSMENSGVCVSAIGEGSATLTLGAGGQSITLPVTVSPSSVVSLSEIALANLESGYQVKVGKNIYTTVFFHPTGAPSYKLEWTVTDPSIITVSPSYNTESAKITGVSPGTTTLTVYTKDLVDGVRYQDSVQVTCYSSQTSVEPEEPETPVEPEEPEELETPVQPVEPGTQAEDIDLSANYVSLIPGEQVRLLSYVRPSAAAQSVTWTSSDTAVATVSRDGRVTAVADGSTTVVARTVDGSVSASCYVSVETSENGEPFYFTDITPDMYFYDAVAWATCQFLVSAPQAQDFGISTGCSRLEIVRYLWKLMGSPQPTDTGNQPFADMSGYTSKDDQWAVQWAVEAGITKGVSATAFSPKTTVTRAQAVTFLHRAAGLPKVTGSVSFTDVAGLSWFADAAVWAVENGITNGTSSTTFTPNRTCSRVEILTFLYRQFG